MLHCTLPVIIGSEIIACFIVSKSDLISFRSIEELRVVWKTECLTQLLNCYRQYCISDRFFISIDGDFVEKCQDTLLKTRSFACLSKAMIMNAHNYEHYFKIAYFQYPFNLRLTKTNSWYKKRQRAVLTMDSRREFLRF